MTVSKNKINYWNKRKYSLYSFDDLLDDINSYFDKYGKLDIKVIYSWIRNLYKNNNRFLKFNKDYKYKRYYDLFQKKYSELVFDIIKDLDNEGLLENKIEQHKAYRKLIKQEKNWYKQLNLLYPDNRINRKTPSYTLKNGLSFNPSITPFRKNYQCNEIIGVDTETYEGKCKLICNSYGKSLYFHDNNDNFFYELIHFLLYHIDVSNVYRFFFNIDFDVQAILKHLDFNIYEKEIDYLSKGIPVIFKKYEITWIRSKLFSIKDIVRNKTVVYTDLYTFYNIGLGKAGKEYLKDDKLDLVNSKRLNDDIEYWHYNLDLIKEYCIKDCILTQKLGWLLVDSIKEVGLKLPRYLCSPASISKANYRFRSNNPKNKLEGIIPSIKDNCSMKLIQIAYDCYFGGRFEILSKGYFKKGYLYDINSQYPDFIKDLPDMENGFWKIYKNLKELPKERTFGYFKCLLKIPYNNYISTIPNKNGIVRFHNGYVVNWFSWYDLDLMRGYIVKIKKAYIFEKLYCNFKPFKDKTIEFYNRKAELKTGSKMLYNTVKITLNGIYGCFIETQERYYLDNEGNIQKKLKGGLLFNPIYASQITSYGRWSVIKSIPKEKWNHILAIHTDSIITDIDCSEYLEIGKEIGQWNLETSGKTLILNTGMYQVGKICKTRGIPKKYIENWFKFCRKNKKLESVEFNIKHMKKIREAIIQDKNILNMNKMFDITRSINLNSDTKRNWIREIKDFNDLRKNNIYSLPLVNFKSQFSLELNPIIISKQTNINIKLVKSIIKEGIY